MSIVRAPRVAGLRAFKGEIVGEGQQQAILDRATQLPIKQVQASGGDANTAETSPAGISWALPGRGTWP